MPDLHEKKMSPLDTKRHSLAHILASAVLEMFPEAKLGIGPPTDNGFYYDFELPRTLIPEDLPLLEEKMRAVISENYTFEKAILPINTAIEKFTEAHQDYKVELIKKLKKEGTTEVSIYKTGDFIDLCRGPHIESTRELDPKSFTLAKTAAAYWLGDEKNPMLQRVYAYAFDSRKELKKYEQHLVEAKKRDHRKLGKQLDLFIFSDLIGPGLPIYTPKGYIVREEIIKFSRELNTKIGFQEVHTPNINKAELFKTSGHYDKYKEDMLSVNSNYSNEEYFLKPMNCPQHTQIFASKTRSYKDLPLRFSDFSNLYRDEKPGELSGLSRLKYFSIDDGHIFCREDQIEEEFNAVLGVIQEALSTYELAFYVRLSLRDPREKEKYLGSDELWESAESTLRDLVKKNNLEFVEAPGEAAFYGPKMDIIAKDALDREWQISTNQLDLNMPERFNLEYTAEDGTNKKPVMLHRGIVGSAERMMSLLIEHYEGKFPTWLAPVQVKILSVSEKFTKESKELEKKFKKHNIRVEADLREESVGKKIKDSIAEKVPYTIVFGEKEIESNMLPIRIRGKKETTELSFDDFIKKITEEISSRSTS